MDIGDAAAQVILPVITEAIQAKNGLEIKLRRLAAEEERGSRAVPYDRGGWG